MFQLSVRVVRCDSQRSERGVYRGGVIRELASNNGQPLPRTGRCRDCRQRFVECDAEFLHYCPLVGLRRVKLQTKLSQACGTESFIYYRECCHLFSNEQDALVRGERLS